MINFIQLKDYCQGDYTQIENYEKALNDKENTWICHHRNGILLHKSGEELDAMGLYYNRPPEELMFLTKHEHNTLHHKDKKRSKETRHKVSESKKGINNPNFGKPSTIKDKHRVYDENGKYHYE